MSLVGALNRPTRTRVPFHIRVRRRRRRRRRRRGALVTFFHCSTFRESSNGCFESLVKVKGRNFSCATVDYLHFVEVQELLKEAVPWVAFQSLIVGKSLKQGICCCVFWDGSCHISPQPAIMLFPLHKGIFNLMVFFFFPSYLIVCGNVDVSRRYGFLRIELWYGLQSSGIGNNRIRAPRQKGGRPI